MPSEREKKRPRTSQEKHVSVVGRKDISLGIRVVQQKEEIVLSVQIWTFCFSFKGNHSPLESGKDSQQRKASNGKKGAGRQTNQVGGYSMEHVSCQERNPAFAFAVMKKALKEVCMVSILSESKMNVSINGFVQEMLIDSGSVNNLMGEEDFFRFKGKG